MSIYYKECCAKDGHMIAIGAHHGIGRLTEVTKKVLEIVENLKVQNTYADCSKEGRVVYWSYEPFQL